ncbi:hypothetical protein [Sphingomonas beigongshangi]|uniref:hypothetical protein n=1 Tax=Sphingomonas beigongshangi TaxID=2782540 RepID=UPI001AEEE824|nr:hypothetical protein [Sphingomonas beigongshangi]
MAVVVLMIEHLGKVFWSTHHSHATAWSFLLSYVNDAWTQQFPNEAPPQSEEGRVKMFFAGEGNEYVIAEAGVEAEPTVH